MRRGNRTGLVELVEAARERALAGDRIAHWHREMRRWNARRSQGAQDAATEVAEEACRLCLGGQFAWAIHVAFPDDLFVPEARWPHLQWLDECPSWLEFSEAVQLAARIDSFLAALESDLRTYALARDCRGDLDLLGVMADWCQDSGLPHAAAEARHLHALAYTLPRGVPVPDTSREFDDEEDYSEVDME